jgi:hypothetical protein
MKRELLANLNTWKGMPDRKPLILRGARQVGKTWLLKQFGEQFFPTFHYINFEEDERLEKLFEQDLVPARILNELKFYLNRNIDAAQDLVIFDEIQRCPRALTSLKYFCEDMPELALCAAGSLLGVCLNAGSFPVGKVTFLDLHPLHFEEFLSGIGEKRFATLLREHPSAKPFPKMAHEQLWNFWKLYLVIGGLPEAINIYATNRNNMFEALQKVRRVQQDLLEAYMADIAKHCGKMNALHIERLWKNIPAQLASTQDGSAPKFRFRDAIPGLRGYEQLSAPLGWLEHTELVIRCSIVDQPHVPLMSQAKENRFKLYFMDVGLLGAISNIPPATFLQYDFGSYQGYVAENFVAQELRAANCRNLYCWQGRTSEVEFLLERNSGISPVEVKSGRVTRSKSLSVYVQRYAPTHAYILSARNSAQQNERTCLPLYAARRLVS